MADNVMTEEVVEQQAGPDLPEVSPEQQQKVAGYVSALSKLLHGKATKDQIYQMLQSGDPMMTIPRSAIEINRQAEEAFKQGGAKPDLDTLFAGSQFLVNDLIEIGNAGGFFQLDPADPNVMGTLVKATIQPYVEEGLKNGTIDPVELQQKVEPLMTDEQKGLGNSIAQEKGMPMQPDQNTAMETYRRQGVLDERGKNADTVAQSKAKQAQRTEGVMQNA